MGDGTQPFPWIHIEDVAGAFHHVIKTESIQGPVNVVAPGSVSDTGATFNTTLAAVMNRPGFVRTPKLVFDFMFGKERSNLMFSKSVVQPKVLSETGFKFKFDTLEPCLKDLAG